jgi:hypothetical protein
LHGEQRLLLAPDSFPQILHFMIATAQLHYLLGRITEQTRTALEAWMRLNGGIERPLSCDEAEAVTGSLGWKVAGDSFTS